MILRLAGVLVALIVLVLLVGYLWQSSAEADELARHPAPGVLYDVGGLQLHLDCRGSGEPTVVLEAGLTSSSVSWRLVHDAMAEQTRVCAWDRPGMGWSEPDFEPVNSEVNADRLHELLDIAGVSGPQVILGMSAGGVFVREYFARYPEHIRGMVLIDSSHEQQAARMPEFPESGYENLLRMCALAQPFGVARLIGVANGVVDRFEISQEDRAVALATLNRSHTCASMLAESQGFDLEIDDPDPPRSLGDLPLIVVTQGKPLEVDESSGFTAELVQAFADSWNELQLELVALSSRGVHRIAERSGHVIQIEQPEAVIQAVADVVRIVRAEGTASAAQSAAEGK